jgi:hypothetical protein
MSENSTPILRGFRYEVGLYVSIPLAWATLLKAASKHHYDLRCNEAGQHGVINGLFNTACDSEYPSVYPVTWSDLDLTTKVAEQLEYHTSDHALIRAIRAWLRTTMDTIAHQRNVCMELKDTYRASVLQEALRLIAKLRKEREAAIQSDERSPYDEDALERVFRAVEELLQPRLEVP